MSIAISRRQFTLGCASCIVAAGALPMATAQETPPFICTTPQFTVADQIDQNEVRLRPTGGSGGSPTIKTGAANETLALRRFQLLLKSDAWKPSDSLPGAGNKIRVGVHFMDGTSWQHKALEQYASEWLVPQGADSIEFVFGTSDSSHIRVLFGTTLNRSAHGRQAKTVYTDQSQPSMWLGDVRQDMPSERIAEVIRHEFGHALGMRHEHQHPQGGIIWNRETVINAHMTVGWDLEVIEKHIFATYTEPYMCAGAEYFDPLSIMMYPIPPGWAQNITVRRNTEIRPADLHCVHSIYM